ncbi:MAG: hypothetical protein ACRBN8_28875 [Nannocystales bacterium]
MLGSQGFAAALGAEHSSERMPRVRRSDVVSCWLLGVALALSVLTPHEVAAGPAGSGEPSESVQPKVVLAADRAALRRFGGVLDAARANLSAQGVALSLVEVGGTEGASAVAPSELAGGALGVFWLDDVDSGPLRVVLQVADGRRFARTIAAAEMDPSTVEETVWLIIQSNSLALAMGARPSMEEEPPAKPKPADPVPPVVPPFTLDGQVRVVSPKPVFELGASYSGVSVGRRLPWQHGAEIDASFHMDGAWVLGAGFSLAWPSGSAVPVGWQQRAELRGGARARLNRFLEARIMAHVGAAGLQWVNADADASGWRALAVAGLDTGVLVRLFGPVRLWVAPGFTAALNRFPLTECAADAATCVGEGRRVVFEMWRVQPRLRAGIRIELPTVAGAR